MSIFNGQKLFKILWKTVNYPQRDIIEIISLVRPFYIFYTKDMCILLKLKLPEKFNFGPTYNFYFFQAHNSDRLGRTKNRHLLLWLTFKIRRAEKTKAYSSSSSVTRHSNLSWWQNEWAKILKWYFFTKSHHASTVLRANWHKAR